MTTRRGLVRPQGATLKHPGWKNGEIEVRELTSRELTRQSNSMAREDKTPPRQRDYPPWRLRGRGRLARKSKSLAHTKQRLPNCPNQNTCRPKFGQRAMQVAECECVVWSGGVANGLLAGFGDP